MMRKMNYCYTNFTLYKSRHEIFQILNISNNRLSEVTPQTLGHLKRLHCIDLSFNRLKSVGPATFLVITVN